MRLKRTTECLDLMFFRLADKRNSFLHTHLLQPHPRAHLGPRLPYNSEGLKYFFDATLYLFLAEQPIIHIKFVLSPHTRQCLGLRVVH